MVVKHCTVFFFAYFFKFVVENNSHTSKRCYFWSYFFTIACIFQNCLVILEMVILEQIFKNLITHDICSHNFFWSYSDSLIIFFLSKDKRINLDHNNVHNFDALRSKCLLYISKIIGFSLPQFKLKNVISSCTWFKNRREKFSVRSDCLETVLKFKSPKIRSRKLQWKCKHEGLPPVKTSHYLRGHSLMTSL